MTFPSTLDEERLLTGTGLRQKSILGLKKITVYAYGQLLNLLSCLVFLVTESHPLIQSDFLTGGGFYFFPSVGFHTI
jgi:hypothetical protein